MSSQDRREICHRLGYRPSDLLQSNCLIWIEGPSDRIYLNHWIKIADPKLQEGWHYSFALYGGRVLSNFSADEDDPRADEFVQLLPINRFPAVVIDSDIKVQGKEINATKKRIMGEVQKQGGYCWVTKGREIENYVSHELRESGIGSVHKKYKRPAKSKGEETQWDDPLAYLIADGTLVDEGLDKVGIAEKIVDLGPKLDQLDLGERVGELVTFVHRANNLST